MPFDNVRKKSLLYLQRMSNGIPKLTSLLSILKMYQEQFN